MKKGKIFKAAVAFLLFAVILLAGCNKESNYPETVEDMQKLLEANEAEFEEFAQLVIANVPENIKEMRLAYTQANQWSFYLDDPEDLSRPELKNISSLKNSKEIRAFLEKYSVLDLCASQKRIGFGIFKPSLADQHSNWFNLTSDINKFGRYYDYSLSGEFTEDYWGFINKYWCATSNADIKFNDNFGSYFYSIRSLDQKGYKMIEPEVKAITEIPFLFQDRDQWAKNRTANNLPIDYIYELSEDHILMIYERDKSLYATVYNYAEDIEVETQELDLHGGLLGSYRVDRLNDNTLAYGGNISQGADEEILSFITLKDKSFEVTSSVALLVTDQWYRRGVTINSALTKMAYIENGDKSIVWGDWSVANGFTEIDNIAVVDLELPEQGNLVRIQYASDNTLAYTWKHTDYTVEGIRAGFGLIDLETNEVIVKQDLGGTYMVKVKEGLVLGGDNKTEHSAIEEEQKEIFTGLNRYVTEEEIRTFGSYEFSSDLRWMIPGYNDGYLVFNLYGDKLGSESLPDEYDYIFFAWYDYLEDNWEKEVWKIKDEVFQERNGSSDNYSHMTFALSDTGKCIYAIGFDKDGKTTLSIVEMK